jgi:hypothetical protein
MSRHAFRIGYSKVGGAQVKISNEERLTLGRILQPKPLPNEAWEELEVATSMWGALAIPSTSPLFSVAEHQSLSIRRKLRKSTRRALGGKI